MGKPALLQAVPCPDYGGAVATESADLTMTRALIAIALICSAGCTQIPEVEQAVGTGASDQPYPKLAPQTEINTAISGGQLDDQSVESFEAEVNALKRRGQWLRDQQLQ